MLALSIFQSGIFSVKTVKDKFLTITILKRLQRLSLWFFNAGLQGQYRIIQYTVGGL